MAGDDEQVPVAERPLARLIRAEPDQRRAVTLLAELCTGIGRRYAQIDDVLRAAAHSGDPELQALWQTSEEQRLTGAQLWVGILSDKGPLRPDLDRATAVDLLWLHMSPDQYHRLVHVRGWSEERFQAWLTDTFGRLLLPTGTDSTAGDGSAAQGLPPMRSTSTPASIPADSNAAATTA
jgi:hypothetical protein